jgi:hypothetical protein
MQTESIVPPVRINPTFGKIFIANEILRLTPVFVRLRYRPARPRRQFNGFEHLRIRGAAAEVAT